MVPGAWSKCQAVHFKYYPTPLNLCYGYKRKLAVIWIVPFQKRRIVSLLLSAGAVPFPNFANEQR